MPFTEPFISATSSIGGNTACRNGISVFRQPGTDAPAFLDALYTHLDMAYPKFHKMDQLCKLGVLATQILLGENERQAGYADEETGIVLSNAHGSLDIDLKYAKTMDSAASPALFVYTLPNIVIGEIAIRHRFKGENAFFVFNSFDGNFMSGYVNGLFQRKLIRRCICGWVDLFGDAYDARLMLVESRPFGLERPFTAANIHQLNNTHHG